ncbi:hypothetical protein ILYODFUR_014982, partial [Ilyodon furcidens]
PCCHINCTSSAPYWAPSSAAPQRVLTTEKKEPVPLGRDYILNTCVCATTSELTMTRRTIQGCWGVPAFPESFSGHWSQGGSCLLTQPGLPSARPCSFSLLCATLERNWGQTRSGTASYCRSQPGLHPPSQLVSQPGKPTPHPKLSARPLCGA